jgi:hypothetical protein
MEVPGTRLSEFVIPTDTGYPIDGFDIEETSVPNYVQFLFSVNKEMYTMEFLFGSNIISLPPARVFTGESPALVSMTDMKSIYIDEGDLEKRDDVTLNPVTLTSPSAQRFLDQDSIRKGATTTIKYVSEASSSAGLVLPMGTDVNTLFAYDCVDFSNSVFEDISGNGFDATKTGDSKIGLDGTQALSTGTYWEIASGWSPQWLCLLWV